MPVRLVNGRFYKCHIDCNRCDANGMRVTSMLRQGMTDFSAKRSRGLRGRHPPTICARWLNKLLNALQLCR